LLFAQVLELAGKVGVAMRGGVHARSLSLEGEFDGGLPVVFRL
jgi:hypothetical protein